MIAPAVGPIPVETRFGAATSNAEVERVFEAQRRRQHQVAGSSAGERIAKLRRLEAIVLARREEIRTALFQDYGRPGPEVDLSDIYPIVAEARHAARHVRRWMRPRRVSAPLALLGTRSSILYEPKGVVLIISPWNFPFNLTFGPLVSAIAAGNCAILKPSEMTPHSAACMKRIVSELFDEDEVALIEGDARVGEALLSRPFDHFFFTGSPAVGRIVMKAAAEHLASVTLELGAKSPTIVDRTADLDEAATKIAWGKYLNSGQVCIAPDYLLVDQAIRGEFVAKLKTRMTEIYPDATRGHIVNARHHQRLVRSLVQATEGGAVVISGGAVDEATNDISPTLVENVDPSSALLQQEIFGPLLPIVPYTDLDEALAFIRQRDKPLVLYLFSRSRDVIRRVLRGTSAGGTAINDTLVQFFHTGLPFGGAGASGIGKSHGVFGFEAFSNARGILEQPMRRTPLQLMYPPYTKFKQKLIDFTLKYL
jgi:aldehyde dehydrogenase (NAD+)